MLDLAAGEKALFDVLAAGRILIPQDDKVRIGRTPSAHFSDKLFFQILFTLEDDETEHNSVHRQNPGKQALQQAASREFLEKKDQGDHSGSAPSKKPCFQR